MVTRRALAGALLLLCLVLPAAAQTAIAGVQAALANEAAWQKLKADIDFLDKQVTGYWSLLSQSKDASLWTLWIFNKGEPIKYGLYDRKKRSFKIMFGARPALEGATLARNPDGTATLVTGAVRPWPVTSVQ